MKKVPGISKSLLNEYRLVTIVLFRIISSSNHRKVDKNIYNPVSNIRFWCVNETSQRDVSLTHPKHMLL